MDARTPQVLGGRSLIYVAPNLAVSGGRDLVASCEEAGAKLLYVRSLAGVAAALRWADADAILCALSPSVCASVAQLRDAATRDALLVALPVGGTESWPSGFDLILQQADGRGDDAVRLIAVTIDRLGKTRPGVPAASSSAARTGRASLASRAPTLPGGVVRRPRHSSSGFPAV